MPRRRLISTRVERIARTQDDAAAWLAIHDAERIAAEIEAKRAEVERERLLRMEARRRLAGIGLANALKRP
jgi:hypothetical protein